MALRAEAYDKANAILVARSFATTITRANNATYLDGASAKIDEIGRDSIARNISDIIEQAGMNWLQSGWYSFCNWFHITDGTKLSLAVTVSEIFLANNPEDFSTLGTGRSSRGKVSSPRTPRARTGGGERAPLLAPSTQRRSVPSWQIGAQHSVTGHRHPDVAALACGDDRRIR